MVRGSDSESAAISDGDNSGSSTAPGASLNSPSTHNPGGDNMHSIRIPKLKTVSSDSSSASGPTTPVSAAYLAIGAWAKSVMGSGVVRVKTGTLLALNLAQKRSESMPSDSGTTSQSLSAVGLDGDADSPGDLKSLKLDRDLTQSPATASTSSLSETCSIQDEWDLPPLPGSHRDSPGSLALGFQFHSLAPQALCRGSSNHLGLSRKRLRSIQQLPLEVYFEIFAYLPTSTLATLLLTPPTMAQVASEILKSRVHFITTLEDLRAFTHDVPSNITPWNELIHRNSSKPSSVFDSLFRPIYNGSCDLAISHRLKGKQIGPTFYRAGTIILFAKHFMRLIPEARALLGIGYALVLAWFMCLFYLTPFLGALTLYFAMDVVDLWVRFMAHVIHSLPLFILASILPKTHPLHPLHPPPAPSVPAPLVRRLKFAAAIVPTIPGQSEHARCCGLAGTAWDRESTEINAYTDTTITGKSATSINQDNTPATAATSTPQTLAPSPTLSLQPQSNTVNPKPTAFWGLMSAYTPWHLYLLTHTLSLYPSITHLTLTRISLAWWFRLHPVDHLTVVILDTCEMDETGIGLVAQAFSGVEGIVLRGSEVRCGGWDVESIRRAGGTGGAREVSSVGDIANSRGGTWRGWWGEKSEVKGVGKDDAGLSMFSKLRVVRFEMCESVCAIDAVRMVLDRCPTVERVEFVGCGAEEEDFLEADECGGIIEFEKIGGGRIGVPVCKEVEGLGKGFIATSPLWWEGERDHALKIDCCITATNARLCKNLECGSLTRFNGSVDTVVSDGNEEEGKVFLPAVTPTGYRKCIVIQGPSLYGLRDKWYVHIKRRQRRLWGH